MRMPLAEPIKVVHGLGLTNMLMSKDVMHTHPIQSKSTTNFSQPHQDHNNTNSYSSNQPISISPIASVSSFAAKLSPAFSNNSNRSIDTTNQVIIPKRKGSLPINTVLNPIQRKASSSTETSHSHPVSSEPQPQDPTDPVFLLLQKLDAMTVQASPVQSNSMSDQSIIHYSSHQSIDSVKFEDSDPIDESNRYTVMFDDGDFQAEEEEVSDSD